MTGYTVSFARGADNRQNHAPRDPRLYERAHLVKPADVIFRNHEKVKHGSLLDISRTGAKIAVPQGGVNLGSRLEGQFVGVSGVSIVFVAEVMYWSEWATEAGVRFIGMSGDGARQIGEYISELKGSGKACVVSTSDRMVIVQVLSEITAIHKPQIKPDQHYKPGINYYWLQIILKEGKDDATKKQNEPKRTPGI